MCFHKILAHILKYNAQNFGSMRYFYLFIYLYSKRCLLVKIKINSSLYRGSYERRDVNDLPSLRSHRFIKKDYTI
jgi:hypothetical protein